MHIKNATMRLAPWMLGCLFVAGIAHIIMVLAAPYVARNNAYAKMPKNGHDFVMLNPKQDGDYEPPFLDPAQKLAVCVYDLDRAPILVSAIAGTDHLLTLGFYDSTGRVFYSVNNNSAIRGRIEVVLGESRQIHALEALDDEDGPPNELRLVAPSRKGFILARTLTENRAEDARALAALRNVHCSPRPL